MALMVVDENLRLLVVMDRGVGVNSVGGIWELEVVR